MHWHRAVSRQSAPATDAGRADLKAARRIAVAQPLLQHRGQCCRRSDDSTRDISAGPRPAHSVNQKPDVPGIPGDSFSRDAALAARSRNAAAPTTGRTEAVAAAPAAPAGDLPRAPCRAARPRAACRARRSVERSATSMPINRTRPLHSTGSKINTGAPVRGYAARRHRSYTTRPCRRHTPNTLWLIPCRSATAAREPPGGSISATRATFCLDVQRRRRRTTLITSKPAAPSGISFTPTLEGDSGHQQGTSF